MKLHLLKGQIMSNMVFEWIAVLRQLPRHAERPRFFPNVNISSQDRLSQPQLELWDSQWISHRRKVVCCMVIVLLTEYNSCGQSSFSLGSSYINRSVFCKITEMVKDGLA